MYQPDNKNRQSGPDQGSWPEYIPQIIEPRLQKQWDEQGIYRAYEESNKPKYYCLDFFPYPSAEGLHVGHCRNYVPTDVISRFKRMRGWSVLHPMGWDAFGEPTEQNAVARGIHPRETTDRNTANFRRQMSLIGASYDWSREIDSSDPSYYRWTQWFFLLLYRRGLAYRDTHWQWWCPVCQTTLSSHEAVGGVCWRGHTGVTRKEIPAWYFKITAYADELISALETVDWPEKIKSMQRNWIGRSAGAEVTFEIAESAPAAFKPQPIPVFTTRPDTLYGVTFLALAPEHELVGALTMPDHREEVEAYQTQAASLSEVDRMLADREKTGAFTGGYALHPLTGAKIPIWVADYVLSTYGSGAIMGVPAHDQRDFEFAHRYHLPVVPVVLPNGREIPAELASAYDTEGSLINSGPFNGLASDEGGRQILRQLEEQGRGKPLVQYRMHDWLISRQRYWGAPIPIVYCQKCGELPVPEDQLPILLPNIKDFMPDGSGRSPLARLPDFVNTTCPECGGPAERETDTMGGFACSSWYFLRFCNPNYPQGPFDPKAVQYWMPVDLYVGGAEHAVLHLLYARFWTKVMADAGLLDFREPFARLLNQGQLMGPDGKRMSKSRGNVIVPDTIVGSLGADALRVYELFMAPFEQDVDWSTEGLSGARRFLSRLWNLYAISAGARESDVNGLAGTRDPELERSLHQTIRKVTERIETLRFNTMVSALMEFVNTLTERARSGQFTSTFYESMDVLSRLIAPAAPYIADELWRLTGHDGSVHQASWPSWDPELAKEEMVSVPVQVNGKLRDVVYVSLDSSQEEVEQLALASGKVKPYLDGKHVRKVVYVPGKVVNIVAG